jgi:ubiquinone/menaquinone biosynthesis C-methylase UbiE
MRGHWRKLIKRLHPEGIPWPGSVFYNALSGTKIFLRHYELVAQDVARCGPPQCLLDIGTGPGRLLGAIRKTLPNTELVGIDISPAMVAQAEQNTKINGQDSRINVGVADANALPFADGTFDRVVSTGSLHHWKDPLQALSEAHRVLKVNGYALLYDLVRDMPRAIREEIHAQFGAFRLALLWLHSFEEPFLNVEEMVAVGRRTDFMVEGTRFAGVFCCLILRKAPLPAASIGKVSQPRDTGDSHGLAPDPRR